MNQVCQLSKLLTCLLLFTSVMVPFGMSDEGNESGEEIVTAPVVEQDGAVLQPRARSEPWFEAKPSGSGLMGSLALFLVMLAAVAGFWIYTKRGGNSIRQFGVSKDLRIRETKALGNRQFLVVVEYGEQRMLLGVAPGVINHLCYLETPEPELDVKESQTQ
ncbi:MAG: flagellar biosynthetic protein FliO [Puniceicoccaceae bacterium]